MLSEPINIGKQISNYRLLDCISSSSLCNVYRAEQTLSDHRTVTVKIFHPPLLSQQKRDQFLQETHLLKKLKHPHILPILDANLYEDAPYIVTDYVPGGSLRNRIHNKSASHLLSLQEIGTVLNQIIQALQYAHQRNVMHTNLKPENFLFTTENAVLLTDFRLGTLLDEASPDVSYNASTWPYMAPEQFLGNRDKHSDQYALGCIAYELFTGRPPFIASNFSELRHRHLSENPIAPTHLNLLLPFPLGEAILKALEKRSTDRYPAIKDFGTALSVFSSAHTSVPKPPQINIASPSSPRPFVNQASSVTSQPKDIDFKPESAVYTHQVVKSALPVSTLPPSSYTEQEGDMLLAQTGPLYTPDVLPKHIQDLTRVLTKRMPVPREVANTQNNTVSQPQIDVSDEDTQVLTNEGHLFQIGSKEQEPLIFSSAVHHSVDSITTAPTLTVTTTDNRAKKPLLSSSRRSKSTSPHFSHRTWLIIGGLCLLVVVALIFGLIHAVLPSTLSPMPTPIARQTLSTPGVNPTLTSTPIPVPTHSSAPNPVSIAMPTPSTTPTPSTPSATPGLSPTPLPSPTFAPPSTSSLTVTPTSFQAGTDCQKSNNYYKCTLLLQLPPTHQGNLRWSASSSGMLTDFTPSFGMLAPGQQQSVTIYVIVICPFNGSLFIASKDNKVTIPWSC